MVHTKFHILFMVEEKRFKNNNLFIYNNIIDGLNEVKPFSHSLILIYQKKDLAELSSNTGWY